MRFACLSTASSFLSEPYLVTFYHDNALPLADLISRRLQPRHNLPFGHSTTERRHKDFSHFGSRDQPLGGEGGPFPSSSDTGPSTSLGALRRHTDIRSAHR